ncbi:hypothetical protein [Streptomyces goshikiensis]|uniref:hypothetical protein n=1 Tax=Streptomyces goshikiensis TaxID=1942 RepID=UPI00369BF840
MSDLVAADLFDPGNGWSTRTRERFTALTPELGELVTHLGASDGFWTWRYKVDTAWKRRARALLKAGGADELVRYAVRELARGGSFHDVTDPERAIREFGTRPVSRARGLAIGFLLAAGWLRRDADGLSADLAAVARKNAQAMPTYHRVDDNIAGAAFNALGDLPDPDAMEELWALHYDVTRAVHSRTALVKAVKKAAARRDVPAHELAERTVAARAGAGRDADGRLDRERGAVVERLGGRGHHPACHRAGHGRLVRRGTPHPHGGSVPVPRPYKTPGGPTARTWSGATHRTSARPSRRSDGGWARWPARRGPGCGRIGCGTTETMRSRVW